MRTSRAVIAALIVFTATCLPTAAGDSNWTIRFHGAVLDSEASSNAGLDGVQARVDLGGGFGVGGEYRFSERLGIDLSILFAGLEIASTVVGGNVTQDLDLSMVPFTVGVPIHFKTGEKIDLFFVPSISRVGYMDIDLRVGPGSVSSDVDVDEDIALGAALCADLPFGKGGWAFSTGLRYLDTSAENRPIDPVILTVGFAYRF